MAPHQNHNTRYRLLYGGPIGDSLVAIHVGRTLAAQMPGAKLELLSTRENTFVRELCNELPFITYQALPKESVRTWFNLIALIFSRNTMIVYEPVSSTMSLWWKLILWCARLRPGNVELRIQVVGYERPVPRGVRVRVCDYERMSLFDTPAMILDALDISVVHQPAPALPVAPRRAGQGPYILFCFFAGGPSRSITISHARDILKASREVYPDHRFVLSCGESQKVLAQQMVEGIDNVLIVAGTPAREVLSWLSGADLVVGTNSGVALMAAHLQRPLVAITNLSQAKAFLPDFSPESITLAAWNECLCRPGDWKSCKIMTDEGPNYRCLYYVRTGEVLEAMQRKLARDL